VILKGFLNRQVFDPIALVVHSFTLWDKERNPLLLSSSIKEIIMKKFIVMLEALPKRYREPLVAFGLTKFITLRMQLRRDNRSIHQIIDQMREQVGLSNFGYSLSLDDLKKAELAICAGDAVLPSTDRMEGYVLESPHVVGRDDSRRSVMSRNGNAQVPKRVTNALNYLGSVGFDIHPEMEHLLLDNKEKWLCDQTKPLYLELERIEDWDKFFLTSYLDWRGRFYAGSGILSYQGDATNRGLVCFADPSPFSDKQWDSIRTFLRGEYGVAPDVLSFASEDYTLKQQAGWLAQTDRTFAERYIVQLDTHSSGPLMVALMMRDERLLRVILTSDFYMAFLKPYMESGTAWAKRLSAISEDETRDQVAKPCGINTMYGTAADALAYSYAGLTINGVTPEMSILDSGSKSDPKPGLVSLLETGVVLESNLSWEIQPCLRPYLMSLSVSERLRQLCYLARDMQNALFSEFPSIRVYLNTLSGAANSWWKNTQTSFSFQHPLDKNIIIKPFPHKRTDVPVKDYIDIRVLSKRLRRNLCPMEFGRGRVSACAPCFTHMIDAVIVTLVVNECERMDIPIAPIHDSFGVPIAYVDVVKDIFKQVVIWMFTENDYLGDFCKAHDKTLPERSSLSEFDIESLLDELPSCIG